VGTSGGGRKKLPYRGALASYIKAIKRYQLLSQSGEHNLASQNTMQAKHALVESNLRLVVKIAKEYRSSSIGLEDLISEGNLGLIEAAERFDPSRGVRFLSYASWWIRKYMLRALERHAHLTSSPKPAAQGSDGDSPARVERQRILSLGDFMQSSGERDVIETIASEAAPGPEARILATDLVQALVSVLHKLPEREREILVAHFGLDGVPGRTLQEIGETLGLTRERVRQLERRALERARRLLQERRRGS
jgi:RNA polymerase sigma factor (sigma-70 family)